MPSDKELKKKTDSNELELFIDSNELGGHSGSDIEEVIENYNRLTRGEKLS